MSHWHPNHGLSTMVNHYQEGDNALHAHVTPIFQSSTYSFPDVATSQRIFAGEQAGYVYTRSGHPNATQLGQKLALLEGIDLVRQRPGARPEDVVAGKAVSSGMAAIAASVYGRVQAGDTVITQRALYGNAFTFWHQMAPRLGVNVVWVDGVDNESWQAAVDQHPEATMLYAETPANPTIDLVDLAALAEMAHAQDAWVIVDNTFATPYNQRPLSHGCDVVVHSTTKYLSGHGQIIGGAIVSKHLDYMKEQVGLTNRMFGVAPSPFDTWLANVGLKTFELRMERHNQNAQTMATWLAAHPKVAQVYYPGLVTHPGHELAKRQMCHGFGGMMAFELTGGYDAGVTLMEGLKLATFAVSLGNVDSLIQHPASMTHGAVPPEERRKAGITDGMVRYSIGIENIDDLIGDMDEALDAV